ncbi:hypothetical protein IJ768_01935 [Candidatus Saccharibacteria bacterium]|nr:hypothetical protein [Candidatus Saccharibacteria bacterium]
MNTNGQDVAKAHRVKIIVVSTIAFVVILIVGIWAISAAIGSTKKNDEKSGAEVAVSNEQAKEETTNPTGAGATSPADQYSAQDMTATPAPVQETPVVQEDIPSTGPSEVIFSAIMVGVVVFLLGVNINLIKEN